MKANELIVGCWATSKKWREKPFKFTRINDSGKYYYGITAEGSQVGPFLVEELEPIPLTAEILDRNGFESTPAPSERVWKDNSQEVWLDNEGKNYWANIKKGEFYFEGYIEHTHELQHALRLCGIEKEIVL